VERKEKFEKTIGIRMRLRRLKKLKKKNRDKSKRIRKGGKTCRAKREKKLTSEPREARTDTKRQNLSVKLSSGLQKTQVKHRVPIEGVWCPEHERRKRKDQKYPGREKEMGNEQDGG